MRRKSEMSTSKTYMWSTTYESQIPTHWNLIGRCMTAPPPVLSPSRILPLASSHCAPNATNKISRRFILPFFFNCVSLKMRNLIFCEFGNAPFRQASQPSSCMHYSYRDKSGSLGHFKKQCSFIGENWIKTNFHFNFRSSKRQFR